MVRGYEELVRRSHVRFYPYHKITHTLINLAVVPAMIYVPWTILASLSIVPDNDVIIPTLIEFNFILMIITVILDKFPQWRTRLLAVPFPEYANSFSSYIVLPVADYNSRQDNALRTALTTIAPEERTGIGIAWVRDQIDINCCLFVKPTTVIGDGLIELGIEYGLDIFECGAPYPTRGGTADIPYNLSPDDVPAPHEILKNHPYDIDGIYVFWEDNQHGFVSAWGKDIERVNQILEHYFHRSYHGDGIELYRPKYWGKNPYPDIPQLLPYTNVSEGNRA